MIILLVSPANAGILIIAGNGMVMTGGNSVNYVGPNGITATGADGLLAFQANGISAPTTSGITATGADGFTYLGSNGITATGADGLSIARASGITATGADGFTITDANGTQYQANSILIWQPSGITATGVDGITATGADGITATGADTRGIAHVDGITATGVDGLSITQSQGVTATGADGSIYTISPNGVTIMGADGVTATGADGVLIAGANGITATGVDAFAAIFPDSQTIAHADGITATGADGLGFITAESMTIAGVNGVAITGSNGQQYQANSIFINNPSGITATGADGVNVAGASGITATGADALQIAEANGITATGADGVAIIGANGITATGADGAVFSIISNGVTITGADWLTAVGVHDISIAGAESVMATGAQLVEQTGLQSLDPELAALLNQITDDSNVNAAIVYHRKPIESDIADLQNIGILGGARFRVLPVIVTTATRAQLVAVSRLPAVRAIYGNRTLPLLSDPGGKWTGSDRARADQDLTSRNMGRSLTGRGVTVAVLDTGLDGLHPDLAGRVVNNVKLLSTLGVGVGFNPPTNLENLPNTDLVSGHGTFVGGVIAGSGAASNGKYSGVAPNARLLGLSAGELNMFFVLEGFDYLLSRGPQYGVRVVNCSFSANTIYDPHDPVNVATKLLTERGITVVFSAGNSGPGMHTLNPYAMAPWVISVGATDESGRLASFSSRGDFTTPNSRPTVVAPGVNVVSLRASGLSITGVQNALLGPDLSRLSGSELPFYTVGSGTSFSAPQVAGAIALMLEANPSLTPAQVRDLLRRSATPLPPYYHHEAGAGMLNAHAAALEAAFSDRRMGTFRATLDQGGARFVRNPWVQFSGAAPSLGGTHTTNLQIPSNTLLASVQIAWGPLLTINDLALQLITPNGAARPQVNTLNLPGLTGRFERDVVTTPAPGLWKLRVRNSLGLLGLTPQPFNGVLETITAQYPPMDDLDELSASARDEVYQNLRSFVIQPVGSHFHSQFTVSRAELAGALVIGGRTPQYLAGQPGYSDLSDAGTRLMVESVQAAPDGARFPDAPPGGYFRPHERANRLAAAIALVRAAGLRMQAEAQTNSPLSVSDSSAIPAQCRGYVAVALSIGLLSANNGAFQPSNALTRIELAHAMATLSRLATQ